MKSLNVEELSPYQLGGKAKREYLQFGKFPVNPYNQDDESAKFNDWYMGYLSKAV